MNKEVEKKTAPEGSAQEQTIIFSVDKEILAKKIERINKLTNELCIEINSLSEVFIYQNC